MLDVCFGDSECGALKFCLNKKDVMYSYTDLNMGKLSNNDFDKERRGFINTFFSNCSSLTKYNIYRKDKKRFNKIIKTAKKDKELGIWVAGNAVSKCGFYHLIYNLRNIECNIYVVELPDYDNLGAETSWGCIDLFELKNNIQEYLKLQRKLNEDEINEISTHWEKLVEENASLRINLKGIITSISEDYFDEEILNCAPGGEYRKARHVRTMLAQCKHLICDSFIASRIEYLISKGKIQLVKESIDGDRMHNILKK